MSITNRNFHSEIPRDLFTDYWLCRWICDLIIDIKYLLFNIDSCHSTCSYMCICFLQNGFHRKEKNNNDIIKNFNIFNICIYSLEMILKDPRTYYSSRFYLYWTKWGFTVCEYIEHFNVQCHWKMSLPVMCPLLGMDLNIF